MRIEVEAWAYFLNLNQEIEFEEPCLVELDYSKGCSGWGSETEIICGKKVKGRPLNPPEPPEIEFCGVRPVGGIVWSASMHEAIEKYFEEKSDEELFDLVEE